MTHTTQVLSDEQIIEIKKSAKALDPSKPWGDTLALARAIESATLKAVSGQEPVAWRWMPSQEFPMWVYSDDKNRVMEALRFMGHGGVQPLYTLPPAQPAPVDEREAFKAELAKMPEWHPEFKHHRAWVEPLLWIFWQARAALQCAQAPQATKGQP